MNRIKEGKQKRVIELLDERTSKMIAMTKLVVENHGIDSESYAEQMSEVIEDHGLLTPISVVKEKSKYVIIDGVRRYKALAEFFDGKVPCYIVGEELSKEERTMLALAANKVHRPNDNELNIRYAQMFVSECGQGKIKEHNISSSLSKLTGITDRQARKYKNIANHGTQGVINAVSNNKLTVNEAHTVAVCVPEEKQDDYVKLIEKLDPKTSRAFVGKIGETGLTKAETKVVEKVIKGQDTMSDKEVNMVMSIQFDNFDFEKTMRKSKVDIIKSLDYIAKSKPGELNDIDDIISLCKKIAKKF